jgi:mRNA interferase RelE/StbE
VAEYTVKFVTSAAKEFRSLSGDIKRRVGIAVEKLRQTPRPAGVRKLQGHERLYRIRVGQYRIVYEIDDQANLVRITRVRHRREAYQ